ncbi:glycosyltransferase [Candidatus Woesearchaeota archaeon]|nr:glycosyltransferase [Candidatus Woesearchaeota archaeon]
MRLNYYAMHYHMKQCGVRTVIEDILEALSKDKEIKLSAMYDARKGQIRMKGVRSIHMPELGYSEGNFKNKDELMRKARVVKEKIKKKLDLSRPCIIHAHNIGIFKSCYLGMALQLLAEDLEDEEFRIILQHHDFAEENRPANLKYMFTCTGKTDKKLGNQLAYPIHKNIWYCTINSRDRKLLNKIGIPKNRIFLYPNAIDTDFFASRPKDTKILKQKLKDYAEKNNYRFDPQRRILTSPLKILKRKNITETLLVLKALNHAKDEWQLLITLEGTSKSDAEYGKRIKDYIRKNNIPATIGFGYELLSAGEEREKGMNNIIDLFNISEAIITTSVQEGFGFTYVEGWVADKKVIGRRLPYIFHDFEANGIDLKHFYTELKVKGKEFLRYDEADKIRMLDKADYDKLTQQLKPMIDFLYSKKSDSIIRNNKRQILKHYAKDSYRKRLSEFLKQAKIPESWSKPTIDNNEIIRIFKR